MVRLVPTIELQRGTRGDSNHQGTPPGKPAAAARKAQDGRPDEPAVVVPNGSRSAREVCSAEGR
jgi:hypothetical protein